MHLNPNLYQEIYRISSLRANWWEYFEGMYFVTINTKYSRHYFGRIIRNPQTGIKQINYSKLGVFVNYEIPKIMNHHPYTYIPSWVVMPNHVHFIIMIDAIKCRNDVGRNGNDDVGRNGNDDVGRNGNDDVGRNGNDDVGRNGNGNDDVNIGRDVLRHVSTFDISPGMTLPEMTSHALSNSSSEFMASIAPKSGSLASVIGRFKGAVTKYANDNHIPFCWQARYYDRIIKDQAGFERVRKYIENNVAKWKIQ